MISSSDWITFARGTMEVAATAVTAAGNRIDDRFCTALDLMAACTGKAITTGVGKSGMAARKLAATLTSTGCPAVYLHPSEAMHGDLGIVLSGDVVIAMSNGGESEELLAIMPAIIARGVPIIAIVGGTGSSLAQRADVVLDSSIEREACPLNLAPTTSVIVAMALGDALAMTLQKLRGFGESDYALNHPGGRLGRRLTLHVSDVMRTGSSAVPLVPPDAPFIDVLGAVSAGHVGAACVACADGPLLGIVAESDLRNALQAQREQAFCLAATSIMNPEPALLLQPDQLAYQALDLMENRPRPISVAPVVDGGGHVIGIVHVHDLVRWGL